MNNLKRNRLLHYIFILIFGVALGLGTSLVFDRDVADHLSDSIRGIQVRQGSTKFTNPLLECEVTNDHEFVELTPFRKELQALVNQKLDLGIASHVSVYFRDLNNGPWIGINEKDTFSPSSLLKVPLMMSYFSYAEEKPEILDTEVIYNGTFDNNERQNIPPDNKVEAGKKYKIKDLIERSIIYSDNNATEILSVNIPQKYFFEPYEILSLPEPILGNNEYEIRVKDYATFFRVLFNASFIDKLYSEKALEILSRSTFENGLRAGVPGEIMVSHKFGERIWDTTKEHQLHDCGIVYYPGKPYLLCIMTKGQDFEKLTKVISEISKLVYEKVDQSKLSNKR